MTSLLYTTFKLFHNVSIYNWLEIYTINYVEVDTDLILLHFLIDSHINSSSLHWHCYKLHQQHGLTQFSMNKLVSIHYNLLWLPTEVVALVYWTYPLSLFEVALLYLLLLLSLEELESFDDSSNDKLSDDEYSFFMVEVIAISSSSKTGLDWIQAMGGKGGTILEGTSHQRPLAKFSFLVIVGWLVNAFTDHWNFLDSLGTGLRLKYGTTEIPSLSMTKALGLLSQVEISWSIFWRLGVLKLYIGFDVLGLELTLFASISMIVTLSSCKWPLSCSNVNFWLQTISILSLFTKWPNKSEN